MIEFQNVKISFKQKASTLAAVQDVSFKIESGEIFGIAGSSGAGKSTLMRTINLLQEVTTGQVLVDNKDITKYRGKTLRQHRRGIGMIFQHFNLADNLTVYQNIAFTLQAAGQIPRQIDETVRKFLALVGILDKIDAYPSTLSGGQKQRVAIARALVGGAKILLCDEPTSALDAETTEAILTLIRDLNKQLGVTVVIITHELEVIKNICNRCAVMDNGKLIEIGGVYNMFTNPQKAFTKQLIGHAHKYDLPARIIEDTTPLVKLTFRGSYANAPVISDATIRFGIQFNILVGHIEYIEEEPLGVLYVSPVGEADTIAKALAYLKGVVKEVEVIDNGRI